MLLLFVLPAESCRCWIRILFGVQMRLQTCSPLRCISTSTRNQHLFATNSPSDNPKSGSGQCITQSYSGQVCGASCFVLTIAVAVEIKSLLLHPFQVVEMIMIGYPSSDVPH